MFYSLDSKYLTKINQGIISLQKYGILSLLHDKWIKKEECEEKEVPCFNK